METTLLLTNDKHDFDTRTTTQNTQTNTNLLVFHYARTIRIQTQTHGSSPLNTQNQKYFLRLE